MKGPAYLCALAVGYEERDDIERLPSRLLGARAFPELSHDIIHSLVEPLY